MKMNKLFFGVLSIVFLTACSDDDTFGPVPDDDPNLMYDNGFFVLNEGGSGGGSVTYISEDLQTVQQNVFASVNPDQELGLGLFLQSIFFHEDKAFIISNGSNLITVVNRYTFEFLGEITGGLDVPRYGAVVNGKAYITNQASFTTPSDDFIAVVDLGNMEIENTVLANAVVEYIQAANGKLYVQNAAYGTGNQISVFDPATQTFTATIDLADGLNSFEIENNKLYSLSTTKIQSVDLGSLQVSTLVDFPASFTGAANLEMEGDQVFYTSGDKVYSMAADASEAPTNPVIDYDSASEFGAMYGFEVENGKIYIADGGDFASSSYVQIYSVDGTFEEEIDAGVGPNGFYFNAAD